MTGITCAMAASGSGPLAVTASAVTRNASGSTPDGIVTTVASPNTTPSGGLTPYTYSWARQSGSTLFSIGDNTAQNPTWSGTITNGLPQSAVWRVTVTDLLGSTAFTDITVTLTWTQI